MYRERGGAIQDQSDYRGSGAGADSGYRSLHYQRHEGFDIPGLAIGIVANNRLMYAKGFGVRSKSNRLPVDTRTVFQIGSTTKAFLTATMAIMVDRGKLRWDDRVVDLYPEFRLKDPWVAREFRVFDLAAQRSGLPPAVNDILAMLNFKEPEMIRSLAMLNRCPVSARLFPTPTSRIC